MWELPSLPLIFVSTSSFLKVISHSLSINARPVAVMSYTKDIATLLTIHSSPFTVQGSIDSRHPVLHFDGRWMMSHWWIVPFFFSFFNQWEDIAFSIEEGCNSRMVGATYAVRLWGFRHLVQAIHHWCLITQRVWRIVFPPMFCIFSHQRVKLSFGNLRTTEVDPFLPMVANVGYSNFQKVLGPVW